MSDHRKALRARYGVPCPACQKGRPKAHPSILLPQQRCRIDGYRDPRPELTLSTRQMVDKLEGCLGTTDLTDWEQGFVSRMVEARDRGLLINLSERQVEQIERIHERLFA